MSVNGNVKKKRDNRKRTGKKEKQDAGKRRQGGKYSMKYIKICLSGDLYLCYHNTTVYFNPNKTIEKLENHAIAKHI